MQENKLFILQGETLKYFQRIIYALKNIIINQISEENKLQTSQILRMPLKSVMKRLSRIDLNSVYDLLNEGEIQVFKYLPGHYNFVVERSHLEYTYIIEPGLYEKKLEYVISRTEYIKKQLIPLTYKLESIAFATL